MKKLTILTYLFFSFNSLANCNVFYKELLDDKITSANYQYIDGDIKQDTQNFINSTTLQTMVATGLLGTTFGTAYFFGTLVKQAAINLELSELDDLTDLLENIEDTSIIRRPLAKVIDHVRNEIKNAPIDKISWLIRDASENETLCNGTYFTKTIYSAGRKGSKITYTDLTPSSRNIALYVINKFKEEI